MTFQKAAHRFNVVSIFGRSHICYGQPAHFALFDSFSQFCSVVGVSQYEPRFTNEQSSGFGKFHLPFGSVKKLYAEFFFEGTNLHAQGRLANMKTLRGSAEIQFVSDGNGVA